MAQKLSNFPENESDLTPAQASPLFAERIAGFLWRLISDTFGTAAQKDVAGTLAGDDNEVLTLGLVGDCVGRDVGNGGGELVDNDRLNARITARFGGNQGNLATAAFKRVGTVSGRLVELEANGKFPVGVIPDPQTAISIEELNGAGVSDGTEVTITFAAVPVMVSINSFQVAVPGGGASDYLLTWNLVGRNLIVVVRGPDNTIAFTFVAAGLIIA